MKLLRRTAFVAAAALALAPPAFAQKSADTLRILFVDAVPNVDMARFIDAAVAGTGAK